MSIIKLTSQSPSYSRMREVKGNNRMCCNCGQRYGAHYGDVICPAYDTRYQSLCAPPHGFITSRFNEGTPKGNRLIQNER